jgi:hypothetical protein
MVLSSFDKVPVPDWYKFDDQRETLSYHQNASPANKPAGVGV